MWANRLFGVKCTMPLASAVLGLLMGCGGSAYAQEVDAGDPRYLNRVESPVFETEGDHQAITKRAIICIAQIVKPGLTNAPTVVSSDADAGIIVANNAFEYAYGALGIPVPNRARTTLTFQAKDGRFKITQASIEQFSDSQGWIGIGTWRFSGGDAAKDAIEAISQAIASCVQNNSSTNGDW